jgi:hypothetical protein
VFSTDQPALSSPYQYISWPGRLCSGLFEQVHFFCWLVYVVISRGLVGALISKLGDMSGAAAAMSASSANLAAVAPVANLKGIN